MFTKIELLHFRLDIIDQTLVCILCIFILLTKKWCFALTDQRQTVRGYARPNSAMF